MNKIQLKNRRSKRRSMSTRRRLRLYSTRPRLSVNRSLKHISAQVIDDVSGRTLAAASTTSRKFSGDLAGKSKSEQAAFIGAEIARLAKDAGVETVVFDRGSSKYHGRLKALADAAREAGLKI